MRSPSSASFTPLARLTDPEHDPQWLLAVVNELLDKGLVEVVDQVADEAAPCSSWGRLALALPS